MLLYQTLAFAIHRNIIPDGSYSVSDNQDYFECILKNM